ncbi:MAG TPA: hypothetical protein HA360_00060 [Nanoarchaeota archaeon]|nr:hypothetical protein [Candidatus Woesearchaeota archaeon]HIH15348.1 hypothetical protein [Nanoarchaeota archaeon]HIH59238.1 hypothetical protein [Nanoarchaeota archaeon]HII13447.1 hypothetical protein [Nanoarchaeota archaeon]
MIPSFPLEDIVQKEHIVLILKDKIYIGTEAFPRDRTGSICIDSIPFALEETSSYTKIIEIYLQQYQKEIEDNFLQSLGEAMPENTYADYILGNRSLVAILNLFRRLKADIGYKEYLDMSTYTPSKVPDKKRLEEEFGKEYDPVEEKKRKDFMKGLKTVIKANSTQTNYTLFVDGIAFRIQKEIKSKGGIQIFGEEYDIYPSGITPEKSVAMRKRYINNFFKRYASSISLGDEMKIARKQRHYLQRRFEEEDFHSYGLLFEEAIGGQYNIKMCIPKYYIQVPGVRCYIQFQQAELETKLLATTNMQFLFYPIYYSLPEQHPLIYPERHPNYGQVCLRGYKEQYENAKTADQMENLASLFTLNRHTLFYGTNMTNIFDDIHGPLALITMTNMGNPHRLDNPRFHKQWVSFIPKKTDFIIGEKI